VKWVQATPWVAAELSFQGIELRNEILKNMSGGRFIIETHPSGALMGAEDVFDATHDGTIDAFNASLHTFIGKIPASPMFAAMPLGLKRDEYQSWYDYAGGKDLLMEMLEPYNFGYAQPVIIQTPEGLCWSNVKLDNLAAWKGLKFRTKGIWADILQNPQIGAAVTTLASSELYSALERGIVDALEYSTPGTDLPLGFYEVTKYLMVPGFHQPATVLTDVVNKDSWKKLPEDMRAMYEAANYAASLQWYSNYVLADAEALAFYESLPGLEIVVCPADLQKTFAGFADQEYAKNAATDPFFKKVYDSQRAFKAQYDFFSGYQSMDF